MMCPETFPRTTYSGAAPRGALSPYHRSQGMRSWPLAWSRTTRWSVRGAPRYGIAALLYKIFTKRKETM